MAEPFPPITSRDNPVCKRVRSLQRRSVRNAERAFVVEGSRAVLDALQMGRSPRTSAHWRRLGATKRSRRIAT